MLHQMPIYLWQTGRNRHWPNARSSLCTISGIRMTRHLEDFVQILNTHDPAIKLIRKTALIFLDTTIYKGRDFPSTKKLNIKIFFKKTDTHALLY